MPSSILLRRLRGAGLVLVLACLSLPAVATAQNPFDTPRRPLQAQCTFNADCATGLICAGTFCRAECRSDRDCADNKVCVDGLYNAQGKLLHLGRPSRPVAATSLDVINPGAYYAARCQTPAAQPAGAPLQSPVPAVIIGAVVPVFAATSVSLAASPVDQRAKCPASVTFNGLIGANASGAVTYRIVRSDGGTGAPKVLKFQGAGQKRIAEIWTLSQSLQGSLRIEVLAPNRLTSAPADFALDCES
ncbi:hypothetical protein [Phenylobacterium sp.]|uniref:hypothetical protein n=1 Tax=Phenylobacterium sp. TaxID=1871053 RepID=UPI00286CCF9E|nr:hypothetical protein [Phenylobacterium sp.]